MGNYISCTISKSTYKNCKGTRVILPTGEVRQFDFPVKAAEMMMEIPNYFLVNVRKMKVGGRLYALRAEADLEMCQVYAMFPMKRLNSVVTSADMGKLLVTANNMRKRARVTPEFAVKIVTKAESPRRMKPAFEAEKPRKIKIAPEMEKPRKVKMSPKMEIPPKVKPARSPVQAPPPPPEPVIEYDPVPGFGSSPSISPSSSPSESQSATPLSMTPLSLTPLSMTPASLTPLSMTPASLTPLSITPPPELALEFGQLPSLDECRMKIEDVDFSIADLKNKLLMCKKKPALETILEEMSVCTEG